MKLGRRQGFNHHAEGQIVFLSDFQKLGYWHMLKLSQSDAPAWDFESGMNGANIYFACGEVFRVQSGDNGGDQGDVWYTGPCRSGSSVVIRLFLGHDLDSVLGPLFVSACFLSLFLQLFHQRITQYHSGVFLLCIREPCQ